jgi:ABC-type multidrug transport system ATPase subunit
MASIIEAENLTKFYPPRTKAVDGVSFRVNEDEVFGFLGPMVQARQQRSRC